MEWRITLYPLFLGQNLSAADILCQNFTDVIQPEEYLRKPEPVLDAKEQSWCRRQRACWTSGRGTPHVCMRSRSRNDEDGDELKNTGASKINKSILEKFISLHF